MREMPMAVSLAFFCWKHLRALENHVRFLGGHADRTQRRRDWLESPRTHHTEAYTHHHAHTHTSTHARTAAPRCGTGARTPAGTLPSSGVTTGPQARPQALPTQEPSEEGRRRRPIGGMPTRHSSGAGPHGQRYGARPHPIFIPFPPSHPALKHMTLTCFL